MSTPLLIQSNVGKVTVYLEQDSDGLPATGLTFSDVTIDVKKEGGSFVNKVVDGTNFVELDGGFYEITLTVSETDTLGNLYVRVTGAVPATSLVSSFIASETPVAPVTSTAPGTTTMHGFVFDSSGKPAVNASVAATALSVPTILNPSDGMTITTETVSTKTDASGYFVLDLITGMQVDFFIPSTGFRRTFTVPASPANVFELP